MARVIDLPAGHEAANVPTPSVHSWTFKFRSNALALNFVASMAGPRSRPHGVERWTEPALLGEWFNLAGLPTPASTITDDELEDARTLREAIYRLATLELHSTRPLGADIAVVNHWYRKRPHLPPLDDSARGHAHVDTLTFDELMSLVAADAVDILTGEYSHRIKECGSDKCPILFVDRSRAGNRRWCSERPCGFQNSSKAYRRRATRAGGLRREA